MCDRFTQSPCPSWLLFHSGHWVTAVKLLSLPPVCIAELDLLPLSGAFPVILTASSSSEALNLWRNLCIQPMGLCWVHMALKCKMAPCQQQPFAPAPSDPFTGVTFVLIFAVSFVLFPLAFCTTLINSGSCFNVFHHFFWHPYHHSQHARAMITPALFTCGISWSPWVSSPYCRAEKPFFRGWLGGNAVATEQGLKSGWWRGGLRGGIPAVTMGSNIKC